MSDLDKILSKSKIKKSTNCYETTLYVNNCGYGTITYKKKTHCIRGHEFSSENTYQKKNGRECRICRNAYVKKFYEKNGR